MPVSNEKNGFSVKAYRGDAKTLLAFNLPKAKARNLAGFTVHVAPDGREPFYLQNNLRFKDPSKHAQDAKLPPTNTFNAPIHKFRWVHVPGSLQQGTKPFFGPYTYTVTPRYFDDEGSLQPIDAALSVSVRIDVSPFSKGAVELGFTRGFVQSQAFVNHFGPKALFRPEGDELLFDTSQVAGTNSAGQDYTFADEYEWSGFTAREKIFALVDEVLRDKSLHLDVFAYDLNEPDLLAIFLKLAKQKRIRIILDNAALHHNTKSPEPEDEFEALLNEAAKKPAAMLRGKFGRYAHNKVFIISDASGKPIKVLTGSTNFSVTGLYVNANHVLVFNDEKVAAAYARVFKTSWDGKASAKTFKDSDEASQLFTFNGNGVPKIEITFSPHTEVVANQILSDMAKRIAQEAGHKNGSVLFAVMGLDTGTGPVLPMLRKIHKDESVFSYGISDSPGDGIQLYSPRKKTGVLVSGKPNSTKLPPPFNQVRQIGMGHQVHHKFVVCGFNGPDPVVYCGSSNIAQGGEVSNGDNLLAIHDADIAAVFAIEALTLVDHFDFLDRSATKAKVDPTEIKSASKQQEAAEAGLFLSTGDGWTAPYFDPKSVRYVDRELFG